MAGAEGRCVNCRYWLEIEVPRGSLVEDAVGLCLRSTLVKPIATGIHGVRDAKPVTVHSLMTGTEHGCQAFERER